MNGDVIVCIGCGCDSENACVDTATGNTCSWLSLDVVDGRGVCTGCEEHLGRFIAGDREIADEQLERGRAGGDAVTERRRFERSPT